MFVFPFYKLLQWLFKSDFDFYMFASLISGSILINSKMLVVISKETSFEGEENLW